MDVFERFFCSQSSSLVRCLCKEETRCELAVMSAESVSAFGHRRMDAAILFFSREEGRTEEAKDRERLSRSVCVKGTARSFEGVFQLLLCFVVSCRVVTRTYLCI